MGNVIESIDERACISTGHGTYLQCDRPVGSSLWVGNLGNVDGKSKKFSSFHHRCARFISKRHIKPNDDGIWNYPPSDSVLDDACLFSIETCIQRRRTTISNFVKNRPIYQRCLWTRRSVQVVKNNTGGGSTLVH